MGGTARDNVVIKNIYYMMAYAYRSIEAQGYARLQTEEFDNFADLLAAILALGISLQRKRGFEREYVSEGQLINGVKGRLDLARTARLQMSGQQQTYCIVDEYSEQTYKNMILKRCAELMSMHPDVSKARKIELKRCLLALRDIAAIDEKRIEWGRLKYDRNNRSYQLLMGVCWMVLNDQLLTQEEGTRTLGRFMSNRELESLYEKFVLEYFKREHRELKASAKVITSGLGDNLPDFIPKMQTDITLERGGKTLIIDAKCYGQILKVHFDKEILNPDHQNQIFRYVLHEGYNRAPESVQGMLLYALTKSEEALSETWTDYDHTFHCRTLDLSKDFLAIAQSLDDIAMLLS